LNAIESSAPIIALKNRFTDPRTVTLSPPQGPEGTGHGLRINVAVRRIDWFFLDNGNGHSRIETEEYEVIDKIYDGRCMSDHWSVHIKIKLTESSRHDDENRQSLTTVIVKARRRESSRLDDGNRQGTTKGIVKIQQSNKLKNINVYA
jgi:hypothetical protein